MWDEEDDRKEEICKCSSLLYGSPFTYKKERERERENSSLTNSQSNVKIALMNFRHSLTLSS